MSAQRQTIEQPAPSRRHAPVRTRRTPPSGPIADLATLADQSEDDGIDARLQLGERAIEACAQLWEATPGTADERRAIASAVLVAEEASG